MDIKKIFSMEKSKEIGVAGVKGSIPAAITTALLSGVSTYMGIDLDVENMVGIFFGAGIGSIIGQFQNNPADALRRIRGLFGKTDL